MATERRAPKKPAKPRSVRKTGGRKDAQPAPEVRCPTCSDGSKPKDSPLVTIFGAGIAGLSAAHELIERGCRVQVVERRESDTEEGCCQVGGVAATQWTLLRDPSGTAANASGPVPLPYLKRVPYRIYFSAASSIQEVVYNKDECLKSLWEARPKLGQRTQVGRILEVTNREKLALVAKTLNDIATRTKASTSNRLLVRIVGHTAAGPSPAAARRISRQQALLVHGKLLDLLQSSGRFRLRIVGMGDAEPAGDNRPAEGRIRNYRVEFEIGGVALPGDHGYRFFPGFYRNLDDTMRRTPLYEDDHETGANALSRLKASEVVSISFDGDRSPVDVPRRRARSFEEMRQVTAELADRLAYTPQDAALYQLKLFQFATSCRRRRDSAEFEDSSWFDYVTRESPRTHAHCGQGAGTAWKHGCPLPYSQEFLDDLERVPEAVAGMKASEGDAHTSGNSQLQMMLDQLGDGSHVDRLLEGPTSEAWLDHWKYYLQRQGVRFFVGELAGLDRCSKCGVELVPRLAGPKEWGVEGEPAAEPVYADNVAGRGFRTPEAGGDFERDADFYLLAIQVNGLQRILETFEDEYPPSPEPVLEQPLLAVRRYNLGNAFQKRDAGPNVPSFTDLSGIQLYFRNDFPFARGHTYYHDTAWALTSVAQLQFWREKRNLDAGYLGVLSVDIGEMHRFDDTLARTLAWRATDALAQCHDLLRRWETDPPTRGPGADSLPALLPALKRLADTVSVAAGFATRAGDEEAAFLDALHRGPADTKQEIRALRTAIFGRPGSKGPLDFFRTLGRGPLQLTATLGTNLGGLVATMAPRLDDVAGDAVYQPWLGTLRALHATFQEVTAVQTAIEAGRLPPGGDAMRVVSLVVHSLLDSLASLQFTLAGKTAWQSTPEEICNAVWRQIKLCLKPVVRPTIPDPRYFHLDRALILDEDHGHPVQNRSPYLVTPPSGFHARPGVLPQEGGDFPTIAGRYGPFYEIANRRWLIAGGVAKTHTRITTMEHANESARHAVRAILHHLVSEAGSGFYNAAGRQLGLLPGYSKVEDNELDDLKFLKRVDEILVAEKMPHMVEILRLDEAVIRWARESTGSAPPLNALGELVGAFRSQLEKDFDPLLQTLDATSRPLREFLEKLAQLAMRH